MSEARIARLCRDFWQRAGGESDLPRSLAAPLTWALRLSIVPLPDLDTGAVLAHLDRLGLAAAVGPARRLHACLAAGRGAGLLFIDATDPPNQQRFSLAHEAGHFVLEHEQPRARSLARLGAAIAPVLDGERDATPTERTLAVLVNRPLRPRLHLMERGPEGYACGEAADAEQAADAFALELLAPAAAVRALLPALVPERRYAERERAAAALLRERFGLPEPEAGRYGRRLLRRQTGGPSVREWLGLRGGGDGDV